MLNDSDSPRNNECLDEQKLNEFASAVMRDLDATAHCALSYIGDMLGLYRAMAMAKENTVTPQELAIMTRTNERYISDWLAEQASKQYIFYDPSTGKYSLPREHAAVLVEETSHAYLAGGFQLLISILRQQRKIAEVVCTGEGFDWGDYDAEVFEGQARINSGQYRANLADKWIPSLIDVEKKLRSQDGAMVADIGCGYGISTTIMAKAYPNSKFVGVDNHVPSIEIARKRAKEHEFDNENRLRFITSEAESFPTYGSRYDLVTFFDCFHDMGNPFSVARHAKDVLKPDGTLMLVEMASNDKIEDNIKSPVGTSGYAGSIFVCLPTAFAQMKKLGMYADSQYEKEASLLPLGGMPGPKMIETILRTCGFSKIRCAFKNEYNMVLEAKP